ncbi:hypothetical protein [Actinoplanes subglobosus]|uniref:Lipoprotein n=1 Tax=Actinoplanes subglobosus TaxID=1547892 RepID=A0ABV8IIX8_9ACTN
MPVIALAAGLLATGCAGLDPKEKARQRAVEDVRELAAAARSEFDSDLRWFAGKDQSPADMSAEIRRGFEGSPNRSVLDVTVGPDGAARLELVLFGRGEAGGGLSYDSAAVRLCVAIAGRVDAGATAETSDLPCPDDAPGPGPGIGTVVETVQLDD